MRRVLITGMSGTGKSSVVARLAALGYRAVDTDADEYREWVPLDPLGAGSLGAGRDWVWREERMRRLLADDEGGGALFVSGTSSNQAKFYDRFDHVVLLTAPDSLMVERMATRTNNPYGKDPIELGRQLALKPVVEPLLRRRADVVIDTSAPLDEVVDAILELVR